MTCGILEVNLVCSNAETADYDEVGCVIQNIRREFRFRADTNDMDVSATWEFSSG